MIPTYANHWCRAGALAPDGFLVARALASQAQWPSLRNDAGRNVWMLSALWGAGEAWAWLASRPGAWAGFGGQADQWGCLEIDYVVRLGLALPSRPGAWEAEAVARLGRQEGFWARWPSWPLGALAPSPFPRSAHRWALAMPEAPWRPTTPLQWACLRDAVFADLAAATPRVLPWLAPHLPGWGVSAPAPWRWLPLLCLSGTSPYPGLAAACAQASPETVGPMAALLRDLGAKHRLPQVLDLALSAGLPAAPEARRTRL